MMSDNTVPIRVAALKRLCNPYECTIWPYLESPISEDEVRHAMQGEMVAPCDEHSSFTSNSNVRMYEQLGTEKYRAWHVARIAWLAVNGWDQQIQMEMSPVGWPVYDGNHRLAAAIITGQHFINGAISGSLRDAKDAGLLYREDIEDKISYFSVLDELRDVLVLTGEDDNEIVEIQPVFQIIPGVSTVMTHTLNMENLDDYLVSRQFVHGKIKSEIISAKDLANLPGIPGPNQETITENEHIILKMAETISRWNAKIDEMAPKPVVGSAPGCSF